MTITEKIAATQTTLLNAAHKLTFGTVMSQADKLATDDAATILAAVAFELSKPTPANVDALFDVANAFDAATSYADVIAAATVYAMPVPNPYAVAFVA